MPSLWHFWRSRGLHYPKNCGSAFEGGAQKSRPNIISLSSHQNIHSNWEVSRVWWKEESPYLFLFNIKMRILCLFLSTQVFPIQFNTSVLGDSLDHTVFVAACLWLVLPSLYPWYSLNSPYCLHYWLYLDMIQWSDPSEKEVRVLGGGWEGAVWLWCGEQWGGALESWSRVGARDRKSVV